MPANFRLGVCGKLNELSEFGVSGLCVGGVLMQGGGCSVVCVCVYVLRMTGSCKQVTVRQKKCLKVVAGARWFLYEYRLRGSDGKYGGRWR